MGLYEIQVLDCYNNKTYADGTTGGIYGQHPPQANACRLPGEWSTYDIIFNVPHFDADGKLLSPAYATVILNGVVVQNHQAIRGETNWRVPGQLHGAAFDRTFGLAISQQFRRVPQHLGAPDPSRDRTLNKMKKFFRNSRSPAAIRASRPASQ